MRGHVAGAAGIRVVAPCAADVVGALEDDEVLHAVLLQPDRQPQPGEARPDDGHAHMWSLFSDSACAVRSCAVSVAIDVSLLALTLRWIQPDGFSVPISRRREPRESPKALPAPLNILGGVVVSMQAHAALWAGVPADG